MLSRPRVSANANLTSMTTYPAHDLILKRFETPDHLHRFGAGDGTQQIEVAAVQGHDAGGHRRPGDAMNYAAVLDRSASTQPDKVALISETLAIDI